MRFWQDEPVEQWIYEKEELHHAHPWCVMIGGSVRARFTFLREAQNLVNRLRNEFRKEDDEVLRPRYENVHCSSCGEGFGPGMCGFSHCSDHRHLVPTSE